MKRPRVYGNEAKCRTAVARYIARAEELLDQAVGVRNRVTVAGAAGEDPFATAYFIERPWAEDVVKWFKATRKAMSDYLQEQLEEVLPVIAHGLGPYPNSGKLRHAIALDRGEPALREALEELQEMQGALGVRRDVAKAAPAPARFEELHASGLVDEKVINDHAKDMLSPRTPKQLSDAIGSAKELTEATLRAALDRLGVSYRSGDGLPALMKKWRTAIGKLAPPDPKGEAALDKALAALANLVTFVAEWRNAYGRGHGRTKYPPGLTTRHARLASDAAETCVRFIVTTMDDLQLLPP